MTPISKMLPKFFRLAALSYLMLMKAEICSGQQTFKDIFESKIQNKLDRILLPEEYLVDLKILADAKAGSTSANGQYLPGLEVLGPFANDKMDDSIAQLPNNFAGKADLLIVFDKKVSKERAKVAQDIVNRLIEAEGLKSKFKVATMQKDISKVPAPPEASQPPKDPPFIDQIIKEKDFVS
ncbi:MAG: hypothetical protein NT027_09740, partial [Proteobacteria bacterium]|nr:hypothetical protein [Pseudomonadota bacterium]